MNQFIAIGDKYYVLYINHNCGSTTSVSLGEWALYGGGFTIPSQVGHSAKVLITGTNGSLHLMHY